MGDYPRKWSGIFEQQEIYEYLGRLTDEEMVRLRWLSESGRNRYLQTIYGKYTARYAKNEYQLYWNRKGKK